MSIDTTIISAMIYIAPEHLAHIAKLLGNKDTESYFGERYTDWQMFYSAMTRHGIYCEDHGDFITMENFTYNSGEYEDLYYISEVDRDVFDVIAPFVKDDGYVEFASHERVVFRDGKAVWQTAEIIWHDKK